MILARHAFLLPLGTLVAVLFLTSPVPFAAEPPLDEPVLEVEQDSPSDLSASSDVSEEPADDAAVASQRNRSKAEVIHATFQRGVVMLHAGEFERAFSAFHSVLSLAPRLPEAHVNLGFALVGLGRYDEAGDFFHQATTLAPMQANAYYGLALALEERGDLRGAVGAMRTFIHLSNGESTHLDKARAALWEWEARLDDSDGSKPRE